ncbi:hypothetical protein ANN_14439 [Periplaneta americana]|uniref:Uncharacterized protein n=1 Tax=Periplaneta americana TaxID=6978 RepID=A0ABQ8SWA5_PERAM|nr:hypothetical protein ANN_14439 [Periplaneta americana]
MPCPHQASGFNVPNYVRLGFCSGESAPPISWPRSPLLEGPPSPGRENLTGLTIPESCGWFRVFNSALVVRLVIADSAIMRTKPLLCGDAFFCFSGTMEQLNQSGVTVWAALSCKGVIGPIITDTSVDQHVYLNDILRIAVPQTRLQHDYDYYFQQYGVPAHYPLIVRDFLDEKFLNRPKWMGRQRPIVWPPRSPDLTPMDFFFWGVVKDIWKETTYSKFVCRSSTRVCVRICVSIRRPEFECSGSQLEGPEFECSGPQLEGPEFEYSELSLKVCGSRYCELE